MIDVKDLSIWYRSNNKPIVKSVSLSFESGKISCILGRNGSGKSSLLSLIAGVPQVGLHHSGSVSLPRACSVGYVMQGAQNSVMGWLNGYDNIRLPSKFEPKLKDSDKSIDTALSVLGAHNLRLDKHADEMSGGQRQIIAIAREVGKNPDLLVLDEGLMALDVKKRFEVALRLRDWARARPAAVVMVSHSLDVALSVADHVFLMQGSPVDEVAKEELLDDNRGLSFKSDLHDRFLASI